MCFAVKEEASFFLPRREDWAVLITGMGRRNAGERLRGALAKARPGLVITAGFAGGLNPELKAGAVVFDAEVESGLAAALLAAGATAARIHCADRVAVTAMEKAALRLSTGADAVEMESGEIRRICREGRIPGATVRVISDAADEDLPLDFNRLMTADQRLDPGKLAWAVLRSPGKISRLWKLQRQTKACARALADTLFQSLGGDGS